MRIICISSAKIPSDTANSIQVMKVCQAFAQLGHKVHLIVPGEAGEAVNDRDLMDLYGLTKLFPIEHLQVKNRRFFPWAAVWKARKIKADLLYAWPFQSAVLGLLAGMPALLEIHDLPSGHFGSFWLKLFLILPGKKRLLPITKALKNALQLPTGKTVIAPDGVDVERYASLPTPHTARRELHLPDSPTVLCTGHLYEGRGADIFIHLAGKFPKTSFVWVGGREEDVSKWKEKAGGMPNIIFTGFVANARIPLYQASADVLMMPYQQSVATSSGGNTADVCSPMKMFEYMAAGRAILTSDLPVLREVLDENTAVFCPADDLQAWEIYLRRLLQDDSTRKKMGESARRKADDYSWKKRAMIVLEGCDAQVP